MPDAGESRSVLLAGHSFGSRLSLFQIGAVPLAALGAPALDPALAALGLPGANLNSQVRPKSSHRLYCPWHRCGLCSVGFHCSLRSPVCSVTSQGSGEPGVRLEEVLQYLNFIPAWLMVCPVL